MGALLVGRWRTSSVLVLFFSCVPRIYHSTHVVSAATLSADGPMRRGARFGTVSKRHGGFFENKRPTRGLAGAGRVCSHRVELRSMPKQRRAAAAARCLYERAKRVIA